MLHKENKTFEVWRSGHWGSTNETIPTTSMRSDAHTDTTIDNSRRLVQWRLRNISEMPEEKVGRKHLWAVSKTAISVSNPVSVQYRQECQKYEPRGSKVYHERCFEGLVQWRLRNIPEMSEDKVGQGPYEDVF